MRCIIIHDNGRTQIDLVPENEADKVACSLLKQGETFQVGKATGYAQCKGGYLRPFGDEDAVGFTYLAIDGDGE